VESKYIRDPKTQRVIQQVTPPSWSEKEWNRELNRLQEQLAELQRQLDAVPKPKETPDQETLDFWNSQAPIMVFEEGLGTKLRKFKLSWSRWGKSENY